LTIVVLILINVRKEGRISSPHALGTPYDREDR